MPGPGSQPAAVGDLAGLVGLSGLRRGPGVRDHQEHPALLFDQLQQGDPEVRRPAHPLSRAEVELASMAGTGEDAVLDRPVGERSLGMGAGIRDTGEGPTQVEQGDRPDRRVVDPDHEAEAAGEIPRCGQGETALAETSGDQTPPDLQGHGTPRGHDVTPGALCLTPTGAVRHGEMTGDEHRAGVRSTVADVIKRARVIEIDNHCCWWWAGPPGTIGGEEADMLPLQS